jgi:hypothetical protein
MSKGPLPAQHKQKVRGANPCLQRDSSPRPQQSIGSRPTPENAQPPGSARWNLFTIVFKTNVENCPTDLATNKLVTWYKGHLILADIFFGGFGFIKSKIHCRIPKSHCQPSECRVSLLNLFHFLVSSQALLLLLSRIIQRVFYQTTRQVMGLRIGRATSDTVVPRDRHLRHQYDSLNSFRVTNNTSRLEALVSYSTSNFSISQRQRTLIRYHIKFFFSGNYEIV